jgi:hypothetical protein
VIASRRACARRAVACVLACASAVSTSAAQAQAQAEPPAVLAPPAETPSEPEALYRAGREALEAGRADEACGLLERSQMLEPTLPKAAFVAVCHERQGRTALAWREYMEIAESARRAGLPEREARARELAERLAPSLLRVRLLEPAPTPGRTVTIDGKAPPSAHADGTIPLDAGAHRIAAEAPGYLPWALDFTLDAAHPTIEVSIPQLERPPAALPARQRARPPPPAAAPVDRTPLYAAAIATGALGVAGIVVGAVSGLAAFDLMEESDELCRQGCDQAGADAADDARAASVLSTVAFVVGGLGVASSATLLVLASRSPSNGTATLAVGIAPGAVAARGAW